MNMKAAARDKPDRDKSVRHHVWRILWQQLLADASTRTPDVISEQVSNPDRNDRGRDVVLAFAICGEEERHFQ